MNNNKFLKRYKIDEGEKYRSRKYDIFKGIKVFYNDIHTDKIINNFDCESKSKSYEINHCREGKFECVLKDGTITYMNAGDFSINPIGNCPSQSNFPIRHYHGVTVYITPSELGEEAEFLQEVFNINYSNILNKLCEGDRLFIKRATPKIQHIFCEIYNVPENILIPYLKVKIQELFLYLSTIDTKDEGSDREYFTKANVNIVKKLHSFIIENSEKHYKYEELSLMFSINQTTMKRCYKSTYGETIYTTFMKTRLNKSSKLLKTSSFTITEIALLVGYSSNAKYSTAFKKMYNITPLEYRKIHA